MGRDPYDEDETSVIWLSPRSQYTTVSGELAVRIAEDILSGATVISAAAKYGISRSKLMRWLEWGMAADANGAGPEDIHAPYLDFFLKVLQAQGIASVNAQRLAFAHHTHWWLQNHPETRAEYGGDNSGQLLLAAPNVVSDPLGGSSAEYTDGEVDVILRTLIEAGAAVPAAERPEIVEAEAIEVVNLPDEPPSEEREAS